MKIVAHRGESEIAPENTLEAYALAWARGIRCIEGDFQMTRDGEIICLHDATFKRTCGVDKTPAEMTMAEIKKLDAGFYMHQTWKYTRIPTLREILETIPGYGEIFIELKTSGREMVRKIRNIFDCVPLCPRQLTFLVGDKASIEEIQKLLPDANILWGTPNWTGPWEGPHIGPRFTPAEMVKEAQRLGVHGIDTHTEFLTRDHVNAMHAAGLSFNVWTVNDAETARLLLEWGADSITSDRAYALGVELSARSLPGKTGKMQRKRHNTVTCI